MTMNSGFHSVRAALIIAAGILIATKAASMAAPSMTMALLSCALLLSFVLLSQALNFRQAGNTRLRNQGLVLIAALALAGVLIAVTNPSAMARLLPILGAAAWMASLPRSGSNQSVNETAPC